MRTVTNWAIVMGGTLNVLMGVFFMLAGKPGGILVGLTVSLLGVAALLIALVAR